MNKAKLVLTSAIVAAISTAQAYTLDTDAERIGYTIGADMGNTLGEFAGTEDSLSFDALIVGLRDAYQGKELSMSAEEMDETMQTFAQKRMEELQQAQTKQQEENLKAGQDFLDANAKKEGVQTTDSGLQYLVLEEGEGKSPSADANVSVEYEGRLIDGTVFDSSAQAGQPVTFNVNEVIDGWVEGLQLMKEGGKYRLFIPSELAYGEMGAGPSIPPNSTLIFDVELVKINSDSEEANLNEQDNAPLASEAESSDADGVAEETIEEAKANAEQAEQDAKQIAEEVSEEAEKAGEEMDAAVEDAQEQAQQGIEEVERETQAMTEEATQDAEEISQEADDAAEQAQEEVQEESQDEAQAVAEEAEADANAEQAEQEAQAEQVSEASDDNDAVEKPEPEVEIVAEEATVGENAQAVDMQAQETQADANNSLQEMGENADTSNADDEDLNAVESVLQAAGESIEDATIAIEETVSDAADSVMGEDKQ